MALSKVNFNSMNVTPSASKAIKFNSSNNGLETGDIGGSLVLLSTQTASSSSTITFDSGIDSTYKEYIFKFINIHASNDDAEFNVNFRDGSTAYDATKTSTNFFAYHTENDGSAAIQYGSLFDLAQSTGGQNLAYGMGTANDECLSGTLTLFDPSSTTFVKHFIAENTNYQNNDGAWHNFVAGYCNVTAAIDGVQFSMSAGNIDSGTFKLYGVS